MVFVSGMNITGTFHEILHLNIQLADAVDYDVNMNITDTVVAVTVGADNGLMTGEITAGKLHADLLSILRSYSVFITIPRIKTDDVMMSLDLRPVAILVVFCVDCVTLDIETEWIAVDTVKQIEVTWNLIAGVIQNGLIGELIMMHGRIICGSIIVGILDGNMLNNRHDIHPPFLFLHHASHVEQRCIL